MFVISASTVTVLRQKKLGKLSSYRLLDRIENNVCFAFGAILKRGHSFAFWKTKFYSRLLTFLISTERCIFGSTATE